MADEWVERGIDARPRYEALTEKERIQILVEEYRALYGLLSFRLSAADRRLPVAGGTLVAVLGSVVAVPRDSKFLILMFMPAVLGWLLRTTIAHLRSKEDVLRRIDEIERQINQIAGEELLVFQSQHPNRQHVVSGRSGAGTVLAVLSFALAALASCIFLAARELESDEYGLRLYVGYACLTALDLILRVVHLRHYRYVKSRADPCPPSRLRVGNPRNIS